jgi:hypothetical protein
VTKLRVRITSPAEGTEILAGDTLDFGATIKGGISPYEVHWDFGGAAPESEEEDPGPVTLDVPGTYTVTLSCTDAWNNTASASVTITVVPLIAEILSPVDGVTFFMGGTVDFQGAVQGGTAPFAYAWDFNGAAPASTVEDPGVIPFPNAGTYTVTFTVTDANTDVASDTVQVVVLDPSVRTQATIRAYWNAIKPTLTTTTYQINPVMTVDDFANEGQIIQTLIDEGVAWVNFYRWLAGLPFDVTEDPVWSVRCHKGAHVLAMLKINNDTAPNLHDPPLPSGASVLYESNIYGGPATVAANTGGWIACASGNIARGWGCQPYTPAIAVAWFINDNGITSLAHRRFILNPRLSKTAFGVSGDANVWACVMYTIERPSFSAPMPVFDFVAYPSPGFYPLQCFLLPNTLWSFSANSTLYDLDAQTTVTVIRQSNMMNLGVTTEVKPPNIGLTPTISFNPGEAIKNETYNVTIHDILDLSTSQRFDHSYTVTFFDLED